MLGQSPQTAKGETSTGRIVAASQRSEGKRTYEARHQLPCTGPYSSWIQGLHVSSGQPVTRVVMRWWHGCGAHSGSQGNVRSPWCRRTRCYGGRWSRHRLSTGTHPALRNNTHTYHLNYYLQIIVSLCEPRFETYPQVISIKNFICKMKLKTQPLE